MRSRFIPNYDGSTSIASGDSRSQDVQCASQLQSLSDDYHSRTACLI